MKIRHLILLVALALGASSPAFGQYYGTGKKKKKKKTKEKTERPERERPERERTDISERIWGGLNIGNISFGNQTFNLNLAPMGGYEVAPNLSFGTILKFEYYFERLNISPQLDKFESFDWGPTIFARYKVFQQFFIQLEHEWGFFQRPQLGPGNTLLLNDDGTEILKETLKQNYLYIGAGYSSGEHVKYEISLHYNLLDDFDYVRVPLDYRIGLTINY